jgi:hypothetical protein
MGLVAAVAAAIVGVAVPAAAAPPVSASIPTVATPAAAYVPPADTGADISWPQCSAKGSTTMKSPSPITNLPFAIAGVNGGIAGTSNSCFSSQYNAALILNHGATEQPHAAVYLNTGNPALTASWWPSSNKTQGARLTGTTGTAPPVVTVSNPLGTCAHKAGEACAFIYGYSMAESAYYAAAVNGQVKTSTTWWLDVETSNTWQTDTAANAASIVGMVYFLKTKGVTTGLYSTAYQWNKIAGTTSSTSSLAKLPSWLAGASATSAAGDCSTLPALTPGGRVSLVQYDYNGLLDYDYSCHVFSPTPITLQGTLSVGQKITAFHTAWATGATYTYQWYRSGAVINGATSDYHTFNTYDEGKTLTVHVTGHETGYAPLTVVGGPSTPTNKVLTTTTTPTIAGTNSVGETLTADRGIWKPGAVAYTYQWFRGGVAITGATAKTYVLTTADAGQNITVSVTGSETGYTTVTKTSASVSIPTTPADAKTLTTVTPTISGTDAVGQTLTVLRGTWTPGPVAYTYQWFRGGVAITGATAKTYVLTSADAGQNITVSVSCTEKGYTTAIRTSASVSIPAS